MKKNEFKRLIEHIISETIEMMQEAHQTGEWWIQGDGSTVFADGDVGDQGHEAVVIEYLAHEILSHFGVEKDEPGYLSEEEDAIKQNLIDDGRLSEEDLQNWDNENGGEGPSEVILQKLIEDKAYSDPKQAEDALYIAYGKSNRDARDYAMKYWNWKVMKTSGGYIEVQTWHLTPKDIDIIVRGVWEIMEEDTDDLDDSDNVVGDDGYPGPRINVTVQATGRRFTNIPLVVLEKKMPTALNNYHGGSQIDFRESVNEEMCEKCWNERDIPSDNIPNAVIQLAGKWLCKGCYEDYLRQHPQALNEDYHHFHKEYRLYEGNNHIVAIFEDNSRLMFEVHYHNNHGPDREKHRKKAFTKWKSLASKIHGDIQLNEVGNPVEKSWKQSFKEALEDPELQEYMRKPHHKKVYGSNNAMIDPVNFTPRV